ncbi:unnamed protein product [Peniophora sp. CBMAI 1063]|nr:unnamed protein product [Peniophora sp. CBMAI 1063]
MNPTGDEQHGAAGMAPGQYYYGAPDDTHPYGYPGGGMPPYSGPPQMLPPNMQYGTRDLNLMSGAPEHAPFDNGIYRGAANPDPSPPPQSPYGPLSPPISGSDTSGAEYHSNHSRNSSVGSSRGNGFVHRSLRYNPTPSPSNSSGRRSRGRSFDGSDEEMGVSIAESIATTRKEATRRQRIEAEQRRRDELRDGYSRLKDVLPVSNQKSSKVNLLERATTHIVQLEKQNDTLTQHIQRLEEEVKTLRQISEKMAFSGKLPGGQSPAGPHGLASVSGEPPSAMSSPSSDEY